MRVWKPKIYCTVFSVCTVDQKGPRGTGGGPARVSEGMVRVK